MNKWNLVLGLALALCVGIGGLVLVSSTSAMANGYKLDWCVVGGGGNASSTVGQTATGWSTGANQLGSGFWYGAAESRSKTYLPLILRNFR